MNDLASGVVTASPPRNTLDKMMTYVSWVIAGALFLSVGWLAMRPDDPRGAVSLLARQGAFLMWLQAAALAAFAAAIATVIAGRTLADVGVFAAALGLAVVALRGDTAAYFMLLTRESAAYERILALKLAAESLAWFAVIAVSLLVSACVVSWCFPATLGTHDVTTPSSPGPPVSAGFDVPWLVGHLFPRETTVTMPREGLKHTLIVTGTALLVWMVFSSEWSHREVQHGQVCFLVAASVSLGCYVAQRWVPVRSALWPVLAPPLLALLGYLWGSIRAGNAHVPPNFPASSFLRVLPIQYVGVGTAAVLATFWYIRPVHDDREHGNVE